MRASQRVAAMVLAAACGAAPAQRLHEGSSLFQAHVSVQQQPRQGQGRSDPGGRAPYFKSPLYPPDPFAWSALVKNERPHWKTDSPLPHIGCSTTIGIMLGVFGGILSAGLGLYFFPGLWSKQARPGDEQAALWDVARGKAIWTLVCYIGALNVAIQLEFLFSLFVQQAVAILPADEPSVNWAFTIFLICNGLLGPFFAKLASRCGMRLMMLISTVGTLVAYAGLAVLPCLYSFYASYLLGGLSMACLYSTCSISAMRVMPPHLQSIVVGLLSCMNMGLSALISVGVKPMIYSLGIRMGYGILGAFFAGLLAVFTFTLPSEGDRLCIDSEDGPAEPRARDDAEPSEPPGHLSGYRAIIPLYAVFFIDMLGLYFWEGQFQMILNQTQTRYAFVRQVGAPVLFFLCACSRLAWGAIALRTSAMLCMTVSSAIFTVSFVIWAFTLGNSAGTLLGLILTSVTMASHLILMPIMVMRSVDRKSATLLYSILMTAELGGISAPLTATLFDTLGPRPTLLVCCSAPALSTLMKLVVVRWDTPTLMKKSV